MVGLSFERILCDDFDYIEMRLFLICLGTFRNLFKSRGAGTAIKCIKLNQN